MFRPAAAGRGRGLGGVAKAKAAPKAKGAAKAVARARGRGLPKARAKPKAAPGGAAPARRGLRRPAARVRPASDPKEDFKKGVEVACEDLDVSVFKRGQWLASSASWYYGGACPWAGRVQKILVEDDGLEVEVLLTGTQNEDLLKAGTASPKFQLRVHVCPKACDSRRENPNLVHAKSLRVLLPDSEIEWEKNLEIEDEAADLRRRQEEWEAKQKRKVPRK